MNLMDTVGRRDKYSWGGWPFNQIQVKLYDILKEAMQDNRTLLIPSDILPRCCGKTTVLKKLSQEFGKIVMHNNTLVKYNKKKTRSQITNFRGTRERLVLIDEPTTLAQVQRAGAEHLALIGIMINPIPFAQPDKSVQALEELAAFIEQLKTEKGSLYGYIEDDYNGFH